MISTQANRLQGAVRELRVAQLSDQNAAAVAKRRQRLVQLRDDLRATRSFLDAAASVGLEPAFDDDITALIETAREAIRSLAAAVEHEAIAFVEGDRFESALRASEQTAHAIQTRATRAWSDHTSPDEWQNRREIARVLSRAVRPGTPRQTVLGQLVNTADELVRLASNQRPESGDITRWDSARAEYDRLWSQVTGDEDIQIEVLNFIQAAAATGAPLQDFTEVVQAGLERLHLSTNFRVVLNR